jgi:uncharacterized protein (TIGR03435 family)
VRTIFLVVASGSFTILAGQGRSPAADFEAASIKPAANTGRGFIPSPGMIRIRSLTLREIMAFAYGVREYQVFGGPKWRDVDTFDIVAKAGTKATTKDMLPMLQSLLKERYNLVIHREMREVQGYWLSVVKSGPKIRAPAEGDSASSGANYSTGQLEAYKWSMAQLAGMLGSHLNAPVVDKTGLPGVFTFRLLWSDETFGASAPDTETLSERPQLVTAIREQLGLRLESHSVGVETVVIDRVTRPTEN